MRRTDEIVRFLKETCARADGPDALPEQVGVFAYTYLHMTLEEIVRVADGTFEDPPWMSSFAVFFAARYRFALERGAEAPGPWKLAFDEAARGDKRVIRDLLLGVNAHMSYDLVLTLVDDVLDEPTRRYRDFITVNEVLADAVDPVQRALEARFGGWLFWADHIGGRVEEMLTLDVFQRLRQRAWDDAMAVREGTLTREALEARVTQQGRRIAALVKF